MGTFDFDYWKSLAHTDPKRFEQERQMCIDTALQNAPLHMRERLTALQWQIDQVRKLSSTSFSATLQLNAMMWQRFVGERGLNDILQFTTGEGLPTNPFCHKPTEAQVIPFRKK